MPRWLRVLGWLGAAAAAALLVWFWPSLRPICSHSISKAADFLARAGPWGPLLVACVPVLPVYVSPLPVWPVTVAAGARYGALSSTLLSLAGAAANSAINFALARKLGTRFVNRYLGPKWIQTAEKLEPLRFLGFSLLGRLMPISCSDLVACAAGISRIRMPTFLVVAVLGQAPAFYAYAFLGHELAAPSGSSLMSSLLLIMLAALALGGRRIWQRLLS